MTACFDILVIDDEPVVTAAADKVLSNEGFSVDQALDVEGATRKIESNAYSLVLCDLMLPGTGGLELIERMDAQLSDTPVVLITGYATLAGAVQAFRRGVFDFIPKPFDSSELIGVVQRGLRFARANPAERAAIRPRPVTDAGGKGTNGGEKLYALGRHAWAVAERNGCVRFGLGETFAPLDDEIEELELPDPGEDILQGNRCVRIVTRRRSTHQVWAPLSGRVIEVNAGAFGDAGRQGWRAVCTQWVIRIVPSGLEQELRNLTHR